MIWSAVGCTFTMLIFLTIIDLSHFADVTQWTAVVLAICFNFIGYGWVGVI
jgi:hypothetical protein